MKPISNIFLDDLDVMVKNKTRLGDGGKIKFEVGSRPSFVGMKVPDSCVAQLYII